MTHEKIREYAVRALLAREGVFALKGRYDDAVKDCEYVLRITDDKVARGYAYVRISHALERKGKLPEALEYAEKGEKEVKGIPFERARVMNWKANVLYRMGRYKSTIETVNQVLEILRTLEEGEDVLIEKSIAYNTLGSVYYGMRKLKKAAEHYNLTYRMREKIRDLMGIGMALNNLGVVYTEMQEYEKALECLKKSLEIRKKLEHKHGIGSAWINIAIVYDGMGRYREALRAAKKAEEYLKEIGDIYGLGIVYFEIGSIYELFYRYLDAERRYLLSYELREKAHDLYGMFEVAIRLGELNLSMRKKEGVERWMGVAKKMLENMEWKTPEVDLRILKGKYSLVYGDANEGLGILKEVIDDLDKDDTEDMVRIINVFIFLLSRGYFIPEMERIKEMEKEEIKNAEVRRKMYILLYLFYRERDGKKAKKYREEAKRLSENAGVPFQLTG
ncbi:hypothetical protein DRQ18_02330 [bacterium]|nr:MAG: hypothetical protein DRQ18_02330 [bacterium]